MQYPAAHNDHLFRAADGMLLGVRAGTKVIFGENPAQTEERMFLDETFAKMFVRTLADRDIVATSGDGHAASVDERFGESKIVTPGNTDSIRLC